MPKNKKSDVAAKQAYVAFLEKKGYTAHIASSPADIVAEKDGKIYYFEIKMTKTSKDTAYFGAATLTEWHQALLSPDNFKFVVAYTDDEEKDFTFKEFTPDEFMNFSTIPPFKIFFSIPAPCGKSISKKWKKGTRTSIAATKEILMHLDDIYQNMKKECCQ